MTPQLRQKFASIEADLISVASQGAAAVHAIAFQKMAELGLTEPEDIEAVLVGLAELESEKLADFQGSPAQQRPGMEGALRGVALASMLAGPASAAMTFLSRKKKKEDALNNLQTSHPDLFQQDPGRAHAIFDLIHDSAPNIAYNTPVAADLMHQMMAAPQLDVGTVGRMSDIGKNYASIEGKDHGGGALSGLKDAPGYMSGAQALITGRPGSGGAGAKHASAGIAANHVTTDKLPCFFDWSSDACKAAGLTDAFTGSGDLMTQADQGFQFNQMEQGNTMLPLDTVVRELLAKEMELSQREQVIAQQEQQQAEAREMLQQMAEIYQKQTGVDPNTGSPAAGEEAAPPAAEAAPAAPAEEAAPAAPPEAAAAPAEAAPAEAAPAPEAGADPAMADPAADPAMAAPAEGSMDPAMTEAGSSETPFAIQGEEAAPAEGAPAEGAMPAEGEAPAEGAAPAPTPEDIDALIGSVSVTPENEGAAEAALADDAAPMAPAQDTASTGDAPSAPEMASEDPAAAAAGPVDPSAVPAPEAPAEGSEAPPAAEGGEAPAEGDEKPEGEGDEKPEGESAEGGEEAPAAEGGEAPAAEGGEAPPAAEGGEEAPAEGSEEAPAEGEDGEKPKDGDEKTEGEDGDEQPAADAPPGAAMPADDNDAPLQAEAGGPISPAEGETPPAGEATPESIEGTPADAAHDDAPGAPPEGSPEDEVLDAAAADAVNAGTPPPTSMGDVAPPAPAAPPALPAPVAPPAETAALAAGGSAGQQALEHLFNVPIRVSIKLGEQQSADPRLVAFEQFETAMSDFLSK